LNGHLAKPALSNAGAGSIEIRNALFNADYWYSKQEYGYFRR